MILFLILAAAAMLAVYIAYSPNDSAIEAVAIAGAGETFSAPLLKKVPRQPVFQRVAQSPGPLRVGIISGHMGSDSGAECEDGLTEAEVNENLATLVIDGLRQNGVRAELLAEFDERLTGYSAAALVSIHADSCDYINDLATGFKIAGSSITDSSQLSICLEQAYRRETQLPFHSNTITEHMRDYHAFRESAPGTPAAIIETGFLNLDRELLTTQAEIPAKGVVEGILCYLDERNKPATAGDNSGEEPDGEAQDGQQPDE